MVSPVASPLSAIMWRAKLRSREVFIPLSHKPGHAQVDFGEADGIIDGKLVRFHYFCMDLPHSDAPFIKAYPAEVAEAFCEGHVGLRLLWRRPAVDPV
jgi:transposase